MRTRLDRFRAGLDDWAESHLRQFPWREPDASLFEVFVAEFFLTQTPAENVASVYPRFVDQFPSLRSIADSDRAELAEIIEPLGFHNMRASALTAIASEYEELPATVDELQQLERVGPYVAHATLCFACNRELPIVDRNVDRVYARLFPDEWPSTESEQWKVAAEWVPGDWPRRYNLALLDFGAALCSAEPDCAACFASDHCPAAGTD